MYRFFNLENFEFNGKIVGVRVDINSPIINSKVVDNKRIKSAAITIKELSSKGAKIVIMAHQGRLGKSDCISLKNHIKLLEKYIGEKIEFSSEIYSKNVENKIKNLKKSQILLLENLRFLKEETKPNEVKINQILKLENLFDFYVFDAFSVAHREHTSVTGFKKIPMIAGRIMEKEVKGLNKIDNIKSPHIFIFGGAKPNDLIELLEVDLKLDKVDLVLLTGVISDIALLCNGYDLGKKLDFLKEDNYLDNDVKSKLNKLLEKYSDKIILPKDVALYDGKNRIEISLNEFENKKNRNLLNQFLIQDIGHKTIEYFSHFIKNSGSIYFKGPPGNFEDKNFEYGTKNILNLICESKSYTFMGGGHSVTSAQMFNCLDKFSYVSLAGGALVRFLSCKNLFGVDMLENSFKKFEHFYEDFIVVGSNVIDLEVNAPKSFSEFELGDKIKIDENFKTMVGGGGINVSICLSKLGGKIGYLGKLSYESVDKIKNILDKNKINLIESKLTKKPCAKSILVDTKDNDRIIFTYRGQNKDLDLNDFNSNSFRANYYYFTSLMGKSFDTQHKLIKIIKQRNPNSKICYNASSYLIENEKNIKNLIKNIEILILNYDEAQELIGENSITICLKKIRDLNKGIVIITDGSNGAFAFDGEKEYFVNSFKPNKIIDTTGAGDCFGGTFFYFYSKGFGIKKSMIYASKNSSNVISKKGAQDGLMYYDEIVNS